MEENSLNGFYYPMTPKVLLFLSNNSSGRDKYTILDVDIEQVKYINDLLVKSCHEKIYSNINDIERIIGSRLQKNNFLDTINGQLINLGVMIGDRKR